MKHFTQKVSTIAVLLFFTFACSTKDGDSAIPQSIIGQWFLQTVNSSITIIDEPTETENEDFTNSGLYFDFSPNDTYTTNASIELGLIEDGNGAISSGTYSFTNGVLSLTYDDSDLGIPLTLFLNAVISGDNLTLSIDKDDLEEALTSGIDELDEFSQVFIPILLQTIVEFNITMTLTK